MFFSLAPTPDDRFPEHHQLNKWWFSHDAGWNPGAEAGWYKGYNHPSIQHGAYTTVQQVKQAVTIRHDRLRSYPLWWDPNQLVLTNLLGTGDRVWADSVVQLTDQGMESTTIDIVGDIDQTELSFQSAVDRIAEMLAVKIYKLAADYPDVPKKLFVTGGIDTLLLWALVKYTGIDVEILDYEYFKYDQFTNQNIYALKQHHWAYQQIHHWTEPHILISGCPGDEFFMRSPFYVAQWFAWHNVNILDHLPTDAYHTGYFLKSENQQMMTLQYHQRQQLCQQYPTKQDIVRQTLNGLTNDHQHWHLGNTLTWTPFKNIEIAKIILRLSLPDLARQSTNAELSKALIDKFCPQVRELISSTKNINSRQYLHRILNY